MVWVYKAKAPKAPKDPHQCKLPGIGWKRKGSIWQCDTCGLKWEVTDRGLSEGLRFEEFPDPIPLTNWSSIRYRSDGRRENL